MTEVARHIRSRLAELGIQEETVHNWESTPHFQPPPKLHQSGKLMKTAPNNPDGTPDRFKTLQASARNAEEAPVAASQEFPFQSFADLYYDRARPVNYYFPLFSLAVQYGKQLANRFGFELRIKTTGSNAKEGLCYKYVCCQRQGLASDGWKLKDGVRRRQRESVRCDCKWSCKLLGIRVQIPPSEGLEGTVVTAAHSPLAEPTLRAPVDADKDMIWIWQRADPDKDLDHNHVMDLTFRVVAPRTTSVPTSGSASGHREHGGMGKKKAVQALAIGKDPSAAAPPPYPAPYRLPPPTRSTRYQYPTTHGWFPTSSKVAAPPTAPPQTWKTKTDLTPLLAANVLAASQQDAAEKSAAAQQSSPTPKAEVTSVGVPRERALPLLPTLEPPVAVQPPLHQTLHGMPHTLRSKQTFSTASSWKVKQPQAQQNSTPATRRSASRPPL